MFECDSSNRHNEWLLLAAFKQGLRQNFFRGVILNPTETGQVLLQNGARDF